MNKGQWSIALVNADGGDCVGGYGFAATDGVYAFIRFGFETDVFAGNLQNADERGADCRKMRAEFGPLANHDHVNVHHAHVAACEQRASVFDELQACRAFPFRVGIRKMRADIAKTTRTKDRIAKSVTEHITIRMSHGAFVERNFDSCEDQFSTFG